MSGLQIIYTQNSDIVLLQKHYPDGEMRMEKRKIQKSTIIYIVFIIISLIQGIVYSFKLPFAQVPDELSNYENMATAFGTSGYTSELG